MHLLLKFGIKVFVLLNAKLTLIKEGGNNKKKFYTYARRAALAQVRLSPLPGGVSLGACVTLTRLQRPVQLGRQPC